MGIAINSTFLHSGDLTRPSELGESSPEDFHIDNLFSYSSFEIDCLYSPNAHSATKHNFCETVLSKKRKLFLKILTSNKQYNAELLCKAIDALGMMGNFEDFEAILPYYINRSGKFKNTGSMTFSATLAIRNIARLHPQLVLELLNYKNEKPAREAQVIGLGFEIAEGLEYRPNKIQELQPFLDYPSNAVQRAAIRFLRLIPGVEATQKIVSKLSPHNSASVRKEAFTVLSQKGDARAVNDITPYLHEKSLSSKDQKKEDQIDIPNEAYESLLRIGSLQAEEALREYSGEEGVYQLYSSALKKFTKGHEDIDIEKIHAYFDQQSLDKKKMLRLADLYFNGAMYQRALIYYKTLGETKKIKECLKLQKQKEKEATKQKVQDSSLAIRKRVLTLKAINVFGKVHKPHAFFILPPTQRLHSPLAPSVEQIFLTRILESVEKSPF